MWTGWLYMASHLTTITRGSPSGSELYTGARYLRLNEPRHWKPAFRGCDQVRLKPARSATENSWSLEILDFASINIVLSKQQTTTAQIRLRRSADWSVPLLFGHDRYSHDVAQMDRVKRIWYLSPMRAAKVQASLRIRAVSPEPPLLAHTSSESRGTFRQKARSLASLSGWACAVKTCHDGMLEDTNSLDGAQMIIIYRDRKCQCSMYTHFWNFTGFTELFAKLSYENLDTFKEAVGRLHHSQP